jgi:histidine ammonia-lyase
MNHLKATSEPAYGFNRGFGHNVDIPVAEAELAALQVNLVRSHASGVGEALPKSVVRAAMFLRAHSLSLGASAVRPEVVEALVTFLNKDLTPVVPRYGSVGASGDLAPLAAIALTLIGEGQVLVGKNPRPVPTKTAFKRLKVAPLKLEAKEGLALTNGIQVSTALAALCQAEMESLLETAAIATALSAQVMLGSDEPYDARFHALRPHPGAQKVAAWLTKLMRASPIRQSHRHYATDGEVQDPYNLRCAPQVLGSCYELCDFSRRSISIEINSATDNPLLLESRAGNGQFTKIVSGGHFHGMPIAVALYNHLQSMGIIARLSNMRCVRYVDEKRNKGLGSDLIWPGLSPQERSTSSGMMIAEYTSAALTNALWGAAMPSHLFSLSTDAGQEDHVSMSATLGLRVWDSLPRLAEALAIELAFAAQAAEIRKASPRVPTKLTLKRNVARSVETNSQELKRAIEATVNAQSSSQSYEAEISIQLLRSWRPQERKLSPISERIIKEILKVFPRLTRDRELSSQLIALSELVRSGHIRGLAKLQ